ncbi:F-box domain-containing protein [Orpheovirus IHUMI-LCC2]|uniref:F-box domain-containing protein n=1 Tax=Orpheovirus IHUMI-LCC2 TaxID=2023057 RepID=A0A2I2L5C6_9VIRU|nr:F-box domain-containing protein [Orpheovirus IHUMI-LCC2]SNW62748.1 F-box domain-containing protein [Orpheovirus IHUMI-LCC2]
MEYIPNETKCQILSNLCAKDCGVLSCVNKDLGTLSNSDYIWRRFMPKNCKVENNYKGYIINIYNNYKKGCNVQLPQITKYIILSFLVLTSITIFSDNITFEREYIHTHHIRNFISDYIDFIKLCATFIRDRSQDNVILSMDKYQYIECIHKNNCPSIDETQTNILGLVLLFILYVVSYAILSIPYILLLITHKIIIYKASLCMYNFVRFFTVYYIIKRFVGAKKKYKQLMEVRKRIHNMM